MGHTYSCVVVLQFLLDCAEIVETVPRRAAPEPHQIIECNLPECFDVLLLDIEDEYCVVLESQIASGAGPETVPIVPSDGSFRARYDVENMLDRFAAEEASTVGPLVAEPDVLREQDVQLLDKSLAFLAGGSACFLHSSSHDRRWEFLNTKVLREILDLVAFVRISAELLHEKRHILRVALTLKNASPFHVHWSTASAAFPAYDHPLR